MLERIIFWVIFGFGLSLTPLIAVAAIGWSPTSGVTAFLHLLFQEDLLAVALTLGGASAANVLASATGRLRPVKIACGGVTFIMSLLSVVAYVVIKVHAKPMSPDELYLWVTYIGGATLIGGLLSEALSEA
jgi:hypothetical protein